MTVDDALRLLRSAIEFATPLVSQATGSEGYKVINVTLTCIPNHCNRPRKVQNWIGFMSKDSIRN